MIRNSRSMTDNTVQQHCRPPARLSFCVTNMKKILRRVLLANNITENQLISE